MLITLKSFCNIIYKSVIRQKFPNYCLKCTKVDFKWTLINKYIYATSKTWNTVFYIMTKHCIKLLGTEWKIDYFTLCLGIL